MLQILYLVSYNTACPCIDCAASVTSSSTVTVNNNRPDEVMQVKNAETVYSKPLICCPLSLNQRRKHVPSEECSESPVVVTGCKKPQKSTVTVLEEQFSFNIDEDTVIWRLLRKGNIQPTLPRARNGL